MYICICIDICVYIYIPIHTFAIYIYIYTYTYTGSLLHRHPLCRMRGTEETTIPTRNNSPAQPVRIDPKKDSMNLVPSGGIALIKVPQYQALQHPHLLQEA